MTAATNGETPVHGNLIEVENLKVHFPILSGLFQRETGRVRAVDDITFEIRKGETFGLVGESGCGKTTTGRAVIRLRQPTDGVVRFDGRDLMSLSRGDLRRIGDPALVTERAAQQCQHVLGLEAVQLIDPAAR